MYRRVLALLFSVVCYVSFAQEGKLYEVEYDVKNQTVKTLGFTIAKCSNISIENAWTNWIKARNGKTAMFNKFEANDVTFINSPEKYKVSLNLVEETTDSIAVITTILDGNGMYFNTSSMDYAEVYERLKDLSYEMRKGCYRYELTQANEYLIRLNKQHIDYQTQKGKVMQTMLKNQNELLKLETKKNIAAEKLSTIEYDLLSNQNESKITKLDKQKVKVEKEYQSLDAKIGKLTGSITDSDSKMNQLNVSITTNTESLSNQTQLVEKLKSKLNNIFR